MTEHFNVATCHLFTEVQNISHQLVSPTSVEDGKMSLKSMSEMLILMSMRRKNKNDWKKLMLTLATTMNGMRTFHKTSIWRNNLDLWKRQKLLPRRRRHILHLKRKAQHTVSWTPGNWRLNRNQHEDSFRWTEWVLSRCFSWNKGFQQRNRSFSVKISWSWER